MEVLNFNVLRLHLLCTLKHMAFCLVCDPTDIFHAKRALKKPRNMKNCSIYKATKRDTKLTILCAHQTLELDAYLSSASYFGSFSPRKYLQPALPFPHYPLNRKLCGPKPRFGHFEKQKNILSWQESNHTSSVVQTTPIHCIDCSIAALWLNKYGENCIGSEDTMKLKLGTFGKTKHVQWRVPLQCCFRVAISWRILSHK